MMTFVASSGFEACGCRMVKMYDVTIDLGTGLMTKGPTHETITPVDGVSGSRLKVGPDILLGGDTGTLRTVESNEIKLPDPSAKMA